MKKILLLLLLISTSIGVYAQWKVGRVKQDFKISTKIPDWGYANYVKGELVVYCENRNGTATFFVDFPEGVNMKVGNCSKDLLNKKVEFTGYYFAEIRDPVDDYVNVRKGPGTNHPILGKLRVGQIILFKKTESNWLKVYSNENYNMFDNGYFDGIWDLRGFFYMFLDGDEYHWETLDEKALDKKLFFLGYIYKDRVISPESDSY